MYLKLPLSKSVCRSDAAAGQWALVRPGPREEESLRVQPVEPGIVTGASVYDITWSNRGTFWVSR